MRSACWVRSPSHCLSIGHFIYDVFVYRWQKLRKAELEVERDMQDAQLEKLTTQEREIRKKMEGVTESAARKSASGPLQPVNGDISKGMAKPQLNGVAKKGKKRKAES